MKRPLFRVIAAVRAAPTLQEQQTPIPTLHRWDPNALYGSRGTVGTQSCVDPEEGAEGAGPGLAGDVGRSLVCCR